MISNFRKACIKIALVAVLGSTVMQSSPAMAAGDAVVTIDGSTTVYPVATTAQYQFSVNGNTSSIIGFTGSGHGQTSIGNAFVDIGMSSSNCSASNMKIPNPNSFTTAAYNLTGGVNSPRQCVDLRDNQIGLDALSIIVHPSKASCISNITITQTQQIWQGAITNWSQLGCPAATLIPRSRISTSGTSASFVTLARLCSTTAAANCQAGEGTEEATITATGLQRFQGNQQMLQAIQDNPNHIGYTSLADDVGVGSLNLDCRGWIASCVSPFFIPPSPTTAKNSTYPMTRVLRYYSATTPDAKTQDYLNFILGPFGQSIVQQVGYVPLGTALERWDIEGNGCADIGDISRISAAWQQTGPADPNEPEFPNVRGWVRADVNFDAVVDIGDVSAFGANWQRGC